MSVEQIRSAVAQFHVDVGAYVNDCGLRPLSGSQAAAEQESWGDDVLLKTAFSQGHLLLESAADHMSSVERLLHEPIQTIAPWTCARGTLESAAYGRWLFDSRIDASARVARSLAMRYEGVAERLKIERLVGDQSAVANSENRLNYLEQQATALGLNRIVDARGKRIGVGIRLPSATDCIAAQLNMEFEFRVFSSMAHVHPSALAMLGFAAADPVVPTVLEKDLSGPAAAFLLVRSAQAVRAIVRSRAELFGHSIVGLESAVAAVCSTLPEPLASEIRLAPS